MIIDGISYSETVDSSRGREKAIATYLSFLEDKLGVRVVIDARRMPENDPSLAEPLAFVQTLIQEGIMTKPARVHSLPDEPRLLRWSSTTLNDARFPVSGASLHSARDALFATAGEAIERYLWAEATDHFESPLRATEREMLGSTHVALSRFAGFSEEQRRSIAKLRLPEEARYLWVQGESLVSGLPTYVPAQTVTGAQVRHHEGIWEPLVRIAISTGAATWPSKAGARLLGALEVIERDAYMIWWLNQLVLPRIPYETLCTMSAPLDEAMQKCARYRLKVHAIRLVTDAPAHAIAVILEDESGRAPHFAIGLKARTSLASAVEGALIEALRARTFVRREKAWSDAAKSAIGHYGRVLYWAEPQHAIALAPLISGPHATVKYEAWDDDSPEQHLERITSWCKEHSYEFIAVSPGESRKNPLPWAVEMVTIPELQPTYLTEDLRQASGERLKNIPEKFGYEALSKPYIDAPHPFA